jgi:hypothetical protein
LSDEKEQIALMQKAASKYANSGNCLIIANQILRMCTNYDNLIKPLVATMSDGSFQELALDMMAFSILRNLMERHDTYKVLDSEAFVSKELRNLTEFTALFYKSFPEVDLLPLMTYILNRMKTDHCHETIVLSRIMQAMFGWRDL